MQVDHHSLFHLSAFSYLYFIPPFHSTSFGFFLFSFYLMFDLGLVSTLYSCLFDMFIHLLSFFSCGILRSATHGVFYALHLMHEGCGDYIIGIIEPSFLSFISSYYLSLCYVLSLRTTLRPWLHTLCLKTHTWAIIKIGWRLFLRAWWMRSYDMICTRAYPPYQWWIFEGDVIYTRAHSAHRWQFLIGMTSCTEA